MEKEDEELKIAQNQDLNEEAEYTGNKQDLELMLLDAQRYLNIFHQIHIFNDKKKAEFEQSLVEIPDRLRAVLLNLPGGRVLLEHIEDCEIKRGLRKERTVFGNENPIIKQEKEMEQSSLKSKEFSKELAEAIAGAMTECNKGLLEINEKIMQNVVHSSEDDKDSAKQTKVLADVLRENNQQQMEMMKTFGATLSQAILMSQKEIFGASSPTSKVSLAPQNNEARSNVTQMPEKNENFSSSVAVFPNKSSGNEEPVKTKTEEKTLKQENTFQNESEIRNPKSEELKQDLKSTEPKRDAAIAEEKTSKKDNFSEVNINSLLSSDSENDKKTSNKSGLLSSISPALQKIKNALTEPDDISVESLKIEPLSLDDKEDDLANSFSQAFNATKDKTLSQTEKLPETNKQAPEEEWEYVDENGNPIDPNEWEYVDENGNPIDPSEWEYVDENGNPIDPSEWEYVDENGNPIAK